MVYEATVGTSFNQQLKKAADLLKDDLDPDSVFIVSIEDSTDCLSGFRDCKVPMWSYMDGDYVMV